MITVTEKVDFIKRAFGGITHDREYLNVSVTCPWCLQADHTYSKKKLVIHTGRWIYHCWRCGARGKSMIPLLRMSGAADLIEEFIDRFTSGSTWVPVDDDDETPRPIVRLPEDFRMLAAHVGSPDPTVRRAIAYLQSRGVTTRDLWYFKFGTSLLDEFIDRVIMPSFDLSGNLNYYTARRIDGKSWSKYMNADASRNEIIFNELNIDWKSPLTVVEGPFDLVKCPENAVPILGCELNEESLLFDAILRYGTPIVMMLDPEAQERQERIARRLYSYDIDVSIANIDAEDPAVMTLGQVRSALAHAHRWTSDGSLRSRIAAL